jgi:hypothetical protein
MKKYFDVLLLSMTVICLEAQTNTAYAQSSRDYMQSVCNRAYQNYLSYNNSGTSLSNMMIANQALITVTDCATKYANLVRKNSSYCNDALSYVNQISPLMSTAAITIRGDCSR